MGITETFNERKDAEFALENGLNAGIFCVLIFNPASNGSYLLGTIIPILQGVNSIINSCLPFFGTVKAGNEGSFAMIWFGHALKCFVDASMFVNYTICTFTEGFPNGVGWGIACLLGCANTFGLWMFEIALSSTAAKAAKELEKEAGSQVAV